jgi:hypothetical protein
LILLAGYLADHVLATWSYDINKHVMRRRKQEKSSRKSGIHVLDQTRGTAFDLVRWTP